MVETKEVEEEEAVEREERGRVGEGGGWVEQDRHRKGREEREKETKKEGWQEE